MTRRALFQTLVSNSRVRPPLLARPYPLQSLSQYIGTAFTGTTTFQIPNHLPSYPITVYRGASIATAGAVLNLGQYTFTQNPGPSVGGTLVLLAPMAAGEWLMVGSWIAAGIGS